MPTTTPLGGIMVESTVSITINRAQDPKSMEKMEWTLNNNEAPAFLNLDEYQETRRSLFEQC
ncbi:hypothetical protein AK830_g9981 [Neonectria ditissima]|uniref:Uncharacterized protein n=1 Tax=Neonectria ditissima TaxID=78410 RepID=A0A0P7B7T5_9HYPO|nr:hypothetical protein AK830_g9981 [Neonectria ditissima]